MFIDELRQKFARFAAILFRFEPVLFRYPDNLLLAAILRKIETAHASYVKRLVNLRKIRVACNDLFAAVQRRIISLLQLEILSRDIQVAKRILLKISIAHRRRIRSKHRLSLRTRIPRHANQTNRKQAND